MFHISKVYSSKVFHFNNISPRTIEHKYYYISTILDEIVSLLENTIEETELYMNLLIDDLSNKNIVIKLNKYMGITHKYIAYNNNNKSLEIYNVDGIIYKSIPIKDIVYIRNEPYIPQWYNTNLPEEYNPNNLLVIKYLVGNNYKTIKMVMINQYILKSYIELVNYISITESYGIINSTYSNIYIRNRIRDIYSKLSKTEDKLKKSDLELGYIVNYICDRRQDISKLFNKYIGIAFQKDILVVVDTININVDKIWKSLRELL